ncbi:hypothetical protein D1646_19775, partial [Pseudoflavonifractor sp. 60]|nr:hypothetical protein [Pseudoflavonifractor sp. 60]
KGEVIELTDIGNNQFTFVMPASQVTGANTFGPDSPCTRGQIVTFLWRAAGSPAAEGTNPFADVASSAYYAQAVQWAVS